MLERNSRLIEMTVAGIVVDGKQSEREVLHARKPGRPKAPMERLVALVNRPVSRLVEKYTKSIASFVWFGFRVGRVQEP